MHVKIITAFNGGGEKTNKKLSGTIGFSKIVLFIINAALTIEIPCVI